MHDVGTVADYLDQFAPPKLAEDWDNVGLLVGDRASPVSRVMTCLTITLESAREAIEEGAQLIVTHHPLPFQPLRRLTTDSPSGRLLLDLIAARIAVYSPHTAFDSANAGINQQLAAGLALADVAPLVTSDDGHQTGRWGRTTDETTLGEMAARVKSFLSLDRLQVVGRLDQPVRSVAVGCGSAGELLADAHRCGCDCFVTGETRFHTCLEAEALEMGLLLTGHYASERFAVERLGQALAERFPTVEVWASRRERDPLNWA